MKIFFIYVGAFFLGFVSINVGFYLVPVYHLPWSGHAILGPISVYLAYFVFGLPLVVIYFRQILKDSWSRALLKGSVTVLLYVVVISSFAFFIMRSTGKV
jgi:hypothetical protein